uniref:glutathione transferase n=1 Tax=Arion vulgaris TaxID=1028688 RepID=A0A0B7BI02_9EUPU
MPPEYKVVYFNLRGRGELLRLLLHAAGVQFVDQRVEFADWPSLKSSTPEGTLPYMVIGGKEYGESMPLARYIARKYSLMGISELDQLNADIILNHIDDIRNAVSRARNDKSLTEDQKKEIEAKAMTELLPKLLRRMETRLTENKHGYLIGNILSIADLAFFDLLETSLKEIHNLLENFPKIREHRKRIETYPRISKYLATRPDTKI